jgi:hypothetical protein
MVVTMAEPFSIVYVPRSGVALSSANADMPSTITDVGAA